MKSKMKVMKVTEAKDKGFYVRIPKAFAEALRITGGYVNIYLMEDKLLIEKTFKNGTEVKDNAR